MKNIPISEHQHLRMEPIEFDMKINEYRSCGEKIESISDVFDIIDLDIKKNVLSITIETGFSIN
jgi:frataxin-like iron-binding protein CyaY